MSETKRVIEVTDHPFCKGCTIEKLELRNIKKYSKGKLIISTYDIRCENYETCAAIKQNLEKRK